MNKNLEKSVKEEFKSRREAEKDYTRTGQIKPGPQRGLGFAGSGVGGGLGAVIGGMVAAKTRGNVGVSMGISALIGGIGGAMAVGKVDMAVARTVTAARKNVLSKGRAGRMSNRVKTGGPGYRRRPA